MSLHRSLESPLAPRQRETIARAILPAADRAVWQEEPDSLMLDTVGDLSDLHLVVASEFAVFARNITVRSTQLADTHAHRRIIGCMGTEVI